jgi:uncharacterized membrane protein YhaH (DUF805 family)
VPFLYPIVGLPACSIFSSFSCARSLCQGSVYNRVLLFPMPLLFPMFIFSVPFSFAMFIFGSLRSQSLSEYYKLQARVLYTCCWFTVCYIFLPLAALALTLRVLYAAGTSLTYLPLVFCLLYFSSARCARTHSESVVRCRHESYILAVGFLFAIFFFRSLRSHSL